MEFENTFSLELIKQYQIYFLDAGYSSYFIPETQINLKAVEYDKGIILQFIFSVKEVHCKFGNTTGQPVSYLRVTSISEGFKELAIKISDFLSGEHNKELIEAIEQNRPCFTGTVVFYDVENSKIYLIKEKKKELWNKEAAQYDVERLIKEMRAMSS